MSGPKRRVPLPSPERVRALVRYDGKDFYWLPRPQSYFKAAGYWRSWTTRHADKKVIIKRQINGYNGIRIDGALILVHRAIWVLHYGAWPKGELDHINGDKTDNRIENLRDCDKSLNMRNQKLRCDNTSGFPGVHFSKHHGTWRAIIRTQGVHKYLGSFKKREDAIAARRLAQVDYGYTAHHGRPA